MGHSNAKLRGVAEAQASAAPSATPARNRCALCVDSDPISARLCRETLEGMGFVIERVDGGVAAVVAARGRVPDLIVMDFQLRDATAGETIGWLRSNQALKSVPIVVLGISDGSRLPAKDTHAMAGIGKPLSPAAILRTVRDLCG